MDSILFVMELPVRIHIILDGKPLSREISRKSESFDIIV